MIPQEPPFPDLRRSWELLRTSAPPLSLDHLASLWGWSGRPKVQNHGSALIVLCYSATGTASVLFLSYIKKLWFFSDRGLIAQAFLRLAM